MNPLLVLEIIDRLLTAAGKYSAIARQAAADGRDISDAELDSLRAEDDESKAALDALIAEKRAGT